MQFRQTLNVITKNIFQSFEEFVSPRHCEICETYIGTNQRNLEFICDNCFYSLPKAPPPESILNLLITNFPEDELFISNAISLFSVAGQYHHFIEIIHSLKYKSFSRVGYELGTLLGKELIKFNMIEYDGIIPVPIHKARKRERGFNQSEIIAKAVSHVIKIPIMKNLIFRTRYTQSQTRFKSSKERKENLIEAFSTGKNWEKIQNRIFLIIDDVLTSGATVNTIAKTLIESGAKRIDVATLAKA